MSPRGPEYCLVDEAWRSQRMPTVHPRDGVAASDHPTIVVPELQPESGVRLRAAGEFTVHELDADDIWRLHGYVYQVICPRGRQHGVFYDMTSAVVYASNEQRELRQQVATA